MVIWQDVAILVISVFLSYALIPQVVLGFKKKKGTETFQTALITFAGLYLLAFIFFTLNLWLSTIITSITATFWLILFIQTIIYK